MLSTTLVRNQAAFALKQIRDRFLAAFDGDLCVMRPVGKFGAKVSVWEEELNLFFDELAIAPISLQVSINLPTDLLGRVLKSRAIAIATGTGSNAGTMAASAIRGDIFGT